MELMSGAKYHMYYTLRGHRVEPIEVPDDAEDHAATLLWAKEFAEMDRRVELTQVRPLLAVSTVFLGLNHSYSWGDTPGTPEIFETMVFHDGSGQECYRSHRWWTAKKIHARVVRDLKRKYRNQHGRKR